MDIHGERYDLALADQAMYIYMRQYIHIVQTVNSTSLYVYMHIVYIYEQINGLNMWMNIFHDVFVRENTLLCATGYRA